MNRYSGIGLTLAIAAATTACSSAPKHEVAPKPEIRRILIVPVPDPKIGFSGGRLSISGLVLQAALSAAIRTPLVSETNSERESLAARHAVWLNEALAGSNLQLGAELSERFSDALKNQGYVVANVPAEFMGPPRDPLELKYEKLSALADAVLIVQIQDSALYEYREVSIYEPQLNLSVQLIHVDSEKRLFDARYFYGNDSGAGVKGTIPSRKGCIFPKLERDTKFGAAVAECFRDGAQRIAQGAAADLSESLR